MHKHEHGQQPGHHKGVQAVEASEGGLANALAAAEQLNHEVADHGDSSGNARDDLHGPVTDLVPGEGIAGHTEGHGDHGHGHAGDPGELTGTLETAGQIHAEDVQDQHEDHHRCAPAVDGADQPAKADVGHQVLHRGVGLSHGRLVIEGHREAGRELHQEADQGDAAQAIEDVDVGRDVLRRDVVNDVLDVQALVEPVVDGR